ncbi:MAG: DUF2232 domain-containing protein [Spirochaetales bacterium]|nr:DUF2232 domain-containing protein [Spirochaetales bacterium]
MNNVFMKSTWGEIAGLMIAAFVLYITGLFSAFFLVPLLILAERKGFQAYLRGSLGMLAGVVIRIMVFQKGGLRLSEALLNIETLFAAIFLLGGAVLFWERIPFKRTLYRLLLATGIIGILSVPIILYLFGNEEILSLFRIQIEDAILVLTQGADPGLIGIDPDELALVMIDLLKRNYLFTFFAILTANWWIGTTLHRKRIRQDSFKLKNFRLPDKMIWGLLLPWTGIFLDVIFGICVFGYPFWNVGFIMLFIYGLQGLGVISYFGGKYNIPRGIRVMVPALLVFLLMAPWLNLVVVVGLPGLGASEIWIHYRELKRS